MEATQTATRTLAGRMRPDELVALVIALDERDGQEERDRRRIDREVHATLPATAPREILRHWLSEAPSAPTRVRIQRVRSAIRRIGGLLLGVGLFSGWATAAGLLRFEVHAGRINIVLFLGLLVALPLLMQLLAVVSLFWPQKASSDSLERAGGGWRNWALARTAMRLLPESIRGDVEVLLGRATAHDRLYGRVRRVLLFRWSQSFGLAFSVGAVLATLLFVVFTDLAFGWSTTLDMPASRVHRLVSALSTPWASTWPSAAPTLDLVETTRHFRVAAAGTHDHVTHPIEYGAWWPFLIMMLALYTIVPRALAVMLGTRRLGREVMLAVEATPGVDRLIERLSGPWVETQAQDVEAPIGRAASGRVDAVSFSQWSERVASEPLIAIAWAESLADDEVMQRMGRNDIRVRDAGGRQTLGEDCERVAEAASGEGAVCVFVRAYEPPMLEILDFLSELRNAIGNARGLAVVLLSGDAGDHEAWQRKLFTLGDPGLLVAIEVPAESASLGAASS